jgi:hypothetical protein
MPTEHIIVKNRITSNEIKEIDPDLLEFTYLYLNGRIIRQSARTGYDVTFKDESAECNLVNEMIDLCPDYCNFLLSRRYKNILFITHMDIHETKWYKDGRPKQDISDETLKFGHPPSKIPNKNYPDLDKIIHFIPVFMEHWDFETFYKVDRPMQPRYSGTLHEIYDRFDVKSASSSCQYEHGSKDWNLRNPEDSKYDAVVFLNIPSKDNKSFSLENIKPVFDNYVSSNCEFVDIWDGDKTGRFEGDKKLSIKGNVSEAIVLKHVSENKELSDLDNFLNNHISVYK